jgi:hypothetical protein
MVHVHNGALFGNKDKWKYFICRLMNGIEDHHVRANPSKQLDEIRTAMQDFFFTVGKDKVTIILGILSNYYILGHPQYSMHVLSHLILLVTP